jgi:serine/threonine-protein kinase HipA
MTKRTKNRKLDLWMNGAQVGSWHLGPQGDSLSYAQSWVDGVHARPLSLSLPLQPNNVPHRGAEVRHYFENLLPDSKDILERVARRYRTGSTDAFDLLAEIGRDCVGALQLLPDGTVPAGPQPIAATPLNEADVAQVLRDTLGPAPIGGQDDDNDFRISIAGAQEKTALLWHNGSWCTPTAQTPTTHIFKLPLGLVGGMKIDMSESVENEWLCAMILREYGLPVANCEPLQFEDMKVLSVERFDRAWWRRPDGDRLIRLPQEDMCQAMGFSPLSKYESDGGPGVSRIMGLLNGSLAREDNRRNFFYAQVLFWMLCATDGHAKNFSIFLRPGSQYELTPLYDVLSAYPLLGAGRGKLSAFKVKMAMAVRSKNAHWKMHEIQRRHWVLVGESYGIELAGGARGTSALLDDLVARTPGVIARVQSMLPGDFPQHVAGPILDGLQGAADKLGAGTAT